MSFCSLARFILASRDSFSSRWGPAGYAVNLRAGTEPSAIPRPEGDRTRFDPGSKKEALNRFLNEYSESLFHIAAITEHGPQAPRSSSDDSAAARLASAPRQRLTIFAGGPRHVRADGRFAKLAPDTYISS